MRPIVLLPESIHDSGLRLLERSCDWTGPWADGDRRRDIRDALPACEAIIVRLFEIGRAVIEAAPRLRVIAKHGVGIDNIDRAAANERGIPIVFTPEANAVAVAEHTLALMLALARNIVPYADGMRGGGYPSSRQRPGIELAGRTLGVVGLGRVGRRVATAARDGLSMNVLAYDEFVTDPHIPMARSLDEVLRAADVLTLHVPLTDATRHLLDDRALAALRPGSRVINTSRGSVVDEAALVRALDAGHVAGAALDVFETEPLAADSPLRGRPNVVLTPHVSSATFETLERTAEHVASVVLDVLEGRRPRWIANPEVL